jgi:hypothetical protein
VLQKHETKSLKLAEKNSKSNFQALIESENEISNKQIPIDEQKSMKLVSVLAVQPEMACKNKSTEVEVIKIKPER